VKSLEPTENVHPVEVLLTMNVLKYNGVPMNQRLWYFPYWLDMGIVATAEEHVQSLSVATWAEIHLSNGTYCIAKQSRVPKLLKHPFWISGESYCVRFLDSHTPITHNIGTEL
jgi:hypothetical protein